MKRTLILSFISGLVGLSALTGCIEDGVATSPSAQPVFSTDTLSLGDNFNLTPTSTARFKAYNRGDKILSISSVTLREKEQGTFRVNVDGMSGQSFRDVEIRPGDSIYIFVEATLPATGLGELSTVYGYLDFVTNGVGSTVVIKACGQDAERLSAYRVKAPGESWDATMPRVIFDSLIVEPGATLTLAPGSQLYFHDKSYLKVYGTLQAQGRPDSPVKLTGDRRGNVVGNIPFDLMASQWEGLIFAPESSGSMLSHAVVSNTVAGVTAETGSQVTFHNCRLRNSAGNSLTAVHAEVTLTGCEVADAGGSALSVTGGSLRASHCTFANYYLFVYPHEPIVSFGHTLAGSDDDDGSGRPVAVAEISNSIFAGLSADFSPGSLDGTQIYLRGCVFRGHGTDDDHFISSTWGYEPDWGVDRQAYIFDYRLSPESSLHGSASPLLTPDDAAVDLTGTPRLPSPTPGAYQQCLDL
ncbi:MAG: right-handed parallel beta-helix repeat-containing protein [Bacteroides sp.]|nr:right-handed parallel beta-helix repeat-containing protein [Bacteroides sp.]MBD5271099.1 right-handed parallel beta-helix repeat-containing protein [Bacteroides sp.]